MEPIFIRAPPVPFSRGRSRPLPLLVHPCIDRQTAPVIAFGLQAELVPAQTPNQGGILEGCLRQEVHYGTGTSVDTAGAQCVSTRTSTGYTYVAAVEKRSTTRAWGAGSTYACTCCCWASFPSQGLMTPQERSAQSNRLLMNVCALISVSFSIQPLCWGYSIMYAF